MQESEVQCVADLLRLDLLNGFQGRPGLAIPVHVVLVGPPMPERLVIHLQSGEGKWGEGRDLG